MSLICLYQILNRLSHIILTECVVYHIKPSTSSICPEKSKQCLTPSQLITQHQAGIFREPSVNLIFLSGNHTLKEQLNINNVTVSKLSAYYSFGVAPTIVCKRNASIILSNIRNAYNMDL